MSALPCCALWWHWRVSGAWDCSARKKGRWVGYALAFAAGAFLCIALSDLLPEIHFHSHDRGKLIASLLVGIGLAYALYCVESSALHGHGMETHQGP